MAGWTDERETAYQSVTAAAARPTGFHRGLASQASTQARAVSGTNGRIWWTMSHGVFSPRYAYIASDETPHPARNRSTAESVRHRRTINTNAGTTIANSYIRMRGRW